MKYLFGLALATMLFSSCSEDMLDRINKDETSKTADKVAAKFQLTDAEVSTAFSTVNGAYHRRQRVLLRSTTNGTLLIQTFTTSIR